MSVTWARAFKAAGIFVLYSLIWNIIGGVILYFGITTLTGFMGRAVLGSPDPYQFAVGVVVTGIGFIIMSLGNMATFFKVMTDIVADEVEGRLTTESPPEQ